MTKYVYNKNILFNEDEISYYILGAFISDGCIKISGKNSYSSTLVSKDKDWLEEIKNLFNPNIKLQTPKNYYKFDINNKEIGDWFIANNCVPRKTLIVKMPLIPSNYEADFIRGIFDGDGCLTIYSDKRKSAKDFKSYICGSSFNLLHNIEDVLHKYNIHGKIIEILQNKNKIK